MSHQAAALMALGAGAVLTALAPRGRATTAAAVYTATLVVMFAVSALYHRPTWGPAARIPGPSARGEARAATPFRP
ncbi:hypothetical protein [Myxococcus sp. RHSTA-1-4]|uniref:hypothetical protein n=1 Tax=Myxococcus sp. RHSTA-1-4 TaxID=2874601 RepID=UPI001CBF9311|nr:hypothetical protein [Myxococcus sp. RHSTA-1-4]MBZ4421964.1 hypothetical protein [Myxococcus sp. RHSTA-1-4]